MQTTIAILNQKGGVGKTTTAVTLASGLARMGCRVLLIDLDTQGNVADSLGLPHGDDLRRLLSPDLRCLLENVVTPSGLDHLDVIRSDKSTTALKQTLAGVTLREYVLADVLQDSGYDVIALDCAPSVDLLHFAALVAADYLLIPTRLDKLAVNGVRDALQTLAALKRISHCQVAGILPTFYERVTLESHEQLIHLAQTFGRLVLPPIPQDTQCRVASRYGKTLWEHEPNAKALIGYDQGNKQIGGYIQVLEQVKELEMLAKKEGVPISQLVAFLLYDPVHQLEKHMISLWGYKTASGCAKFEWNIDLKKHAGEVLGNDENSLR